MRFWMVACCALLLSGVAQGQGLRGSSAVRVMGLTAAAPPDAQGSLVLGTSEITFEVQGLLPGTYAVTAQFTQYPGPFNLGWIAIPPIGTFPDREAGESMKQTSTTHQATVLSARVEVQTPPGLNASQVQRIAITDLFGNVLLQWPDKT